jgi:hypothetical protein
MSGWALAVNANKRRRIENAICARHITRLTDKAPDPVVVVVAETISEGPEQTPGPDASPVHSKIGPVPEIAIASEWSIATA